MTMLSVDRRFKYSFIFFINFEYISANDILIEKKQPSNICKFVLKKKQVLNYLLVLRMDGYVIKEKYVFIGL